MNLGLIALLLLVVAIALGFFRKTNVGLVALLFALILGRYAGIKDAEILKGFNPNLFITLMGVTLLFSILNNNGTIEIMAKKIVSLAGKNNYLIPLAIYLIGLGLTTIGPGSIPILAIMPAFAIPIARAHGYNPLMLALIGCFGCFSGRMSTITPEGILTYNFLAKDGLDVAKAVFPLYANQVISGFVLTIMAFVYYKGYKAAAVVTEGETKKLSFNKSQLISMLGLLLMAVLVIIFKYNVGLVSFAISAALLCLHVAPEGKCIKGIPWGVLLMVSGVSTLMGLVIKTDGIKFLTAVLASMMNSFSAPAVMGATAGIMSLFSSGLGVVFPTLLPTVASVANAVGGVNPIELGSMVIVGGTITGVSPISTTGGLIMATLLAGKEGESKEEEMKLFAELCVWAGVALILLILLALLGVYKIAL